MVPPRDLQRPFLRAKDTRERLSEKQRADWLKQAEAALERQLVLPLRHGYPTAYRCPEHNCPYQLDLVNFKRHYCPVGKHYVEGQIHLDKEAGIRVHSANSQAARALGWAYYLTGDEKYAKKAAEILLAYAKEFPGWDYADDISAGRHCRVGHAVLGECWWSHGMITGYDFIADSPSLTAAQRAQIERDFLLLEAEDIQTHRIAANQQCEINAASGTAAINAQNWYLAARAFTGTYGLFDQIEFTFSEEGFSRENELAYHFASVGPIVEQGQVYEALGGHFWTPRVKRIFDAPLASSPIGDPGYRTGYAEAYAHYQDPAYLFPGGDTPLSNSVLPLAGRTTLRRGTVADPRWMQIMWGSPTWRGGRDMLNYLTPLNTSITRISYGAKLPTPYLSYSTLGGNVPEVDGLQETGVRPRQVFLQGDDLPAAKYVAPRQRAMYPGVGLSRVCAIVDEVYVIVDRLSSAGGAGRVAGDAREEPGPARRFSFSFYPGGSVKGAWALPQTLSRAAGEGGPPQGDRVGADQPLTFTPYEKFWEEGATYKAFSNPTRAPLPVAQATQTLAGWTLDYLTEKKQPARLHVLLDGEGEVLQGLVWNIWNPVQQPGFLTRRTAPAVACVHVLEPGPEYPLEDLQVLPLAVDGKPVPLWQGLAVSLTLPSGKYLLIDSDLPGLKSAAGVSTEETLYLAKL